MEHSSSPQETRKQSSGREYRTSSANVEVMYELFPQAKPGEVDSHVVPVDLEEEWTTREAPALAKLAESAVGW